MKSLKNEIYNTHVEEFCNYVEQATREAKYSVTNQSGDAKMFDVKWNMNSKEDL